MRRAEVAPPNEISGFFLPGSSFEQILYRIPPPTQCTLVRIAPRQNFVSTEQTASRHDHEAT